MSGIREALSGAYAEAEQSGIQEATPAPATEAPAPADEPAASLPATAVADAGATDRARAPDGKFLPKTEPTVEPGVAATGLPARKPPPQSWGKEYHDKFNALPPEVQDYIALREQQAADGISKHRSAYDKLRPYEQALQPFLPALQRHGLDPVQHVSALMNAHMKLATGSPQDKRAMFDQLERQYGVPPRATADGTQPQGAVDPTINWLTQELQQTKQKVSAWQQQQESQAQASTLAEIDRFAKNPQYPHFEALRNSMGQLINAGVAEDLPSAYAKALRLNDDLFTQEQTRQREASELAARQAKDAAAKNARTAALSPRSNAPSADMANGSGKKGLRATIADAVDQHIGRV